MNFIPTLDVSREGVTVSMSPEQLGIRYEFGELPGIGGKALSKAAGSAFTMGLEVSNTNASQESKAFLDLYGKVRFQAGWETKTDQNGKFSSGPTGYIGSPPKK